MLPRPPRPTRPATPLPYTTLCRSVRGERERDRSADAARAARDERDLPGKVKQPVHATSDPAPLMLRVSTPGAMRLMRPLSTRPGPISVKRSEEHTSELQSLMRISYDVFCLKKKKTTHDTVQQ